MNGDEKNIKKSAKGKWQFVKEKLGYVKCLRLQGYDEDKIAKRLEISKKTLRKYKSEYPEFAEAMSFDRYVADSMVEDALLRLATGYVVKSEKMVKLKDVHYDENGKKVETEILKPSTEISEVAPNLAAQTFWLKNRCPERWNDSGEDKEGKNEENGIVILPEIADMVDLIKDEEVKDEQNNLETPAQTGAVYGKE